VCIGNCSQTPREKGCDWHYAARFAGQGRKSACTGKMGNIQTFIILVRKLEGNILLESPYVDGDAKKF
jgi:hypothetical protein